MKQDAVLNAQEVLARYPNVTVIHVIYGTTQHQHQYKRIDVDAAQMANIARASDSLQVVDWNAVKDEQLPGYSETANGKGIFAEDAEHCPKSSSWIIGDFTSEGGTVQLARTDQELKQIRERSAATPSSARSRDNPFAALLQQRSNTTPSTVHSGQPASKDAWQSLRNDYSPKYTPPKK